MNYPITESDFAELLALRTRLVGELGEGEVDYPFVPFVGKKYGEPGTPRVML